MFSNFGRVKRPRPRASGHDASGSPLVAGRQKIKKASIRTDWRRASLNLHPSNTITLHIDTNVPPLPDNKTNLRPPPTKQTKMGWFTTPPPTDASNPSSPQPSSDGAFIAPDRTSRSKCYATRDSFFACLDKAGILDSIAEEEKAGKECGGLDREMGRECAASWVSSVLPGMGLTRWWVDGAVEVEILHYVTGRGWGQGGPIFVWDDGLTDMCAIGEIFQAEKGHGMEEAADVEPDQSRGRVDTGGFAGDGGDGTESREVKHNGFHLKKHVKA